MNKKKITSVTLATAVISAGAASAIGAFAVDSSTETSASAQCATSYNEKYGCADVVDEFNGSQLDTQQWKVFDNDWLSYDSGYISAQNVDVSGGSLNLSIVRNQANVTTSDGKHRTWGSARVAQQASAAKEYGYWEMRVKTPTSHQTSQGTWGGVWMLNTDKQGGEIDIVESYGSDNPQQSKEPNFSITGKASSSVHFVSSTGQRKQTAWNTVGDEWHVYGMEKTPQGITLSIDGVEFLTVDSSSPGYEQSFADGTSMYTIFSAQAGSPYWGQPTAATGDRQTISVDYYRYWDMNPNQSDNSTDSGSTGTETVPGAVETTESSSVEQPALPETTEEPSAVPSAAEPTPTVPEAESTSSAGTEVAPTEEATDSSTATAEPGTETSSPNTTPSPDSTPSTNESESAQPIVPAPTSSNGDSADDSASSVERQGENTAPSAASTDLPNAGSTSTEVVGEQATDSGSTTATLADNTETMTLAEGTTNDSTAKIVDESTIKAQSTSSPVAQNGQKTLAYTGVSPVLLALAVGLIALGISMLMWTFSYKPIHSGPRHSSVRYYRKHRFPGNKK